MKIFPPQPIFRETFREARPWRPVPAPGRLFLATPGALPDCMKAQSGLFLRLSSRVQKPPIVNVASIHF
jgi:hypothetical protein